MLCTYYIVVMATPCAVTTVSRGGRCLTYRKGGVVRRGDFCRCQSATWRTKKDLSSSTVASFPRPNPTVLWCRPELGFAARGQLINHYEVPARRHRDSVRFAIYDKVHNIPNSIISDLSRLKGDRRDIPTAKTYNIEPPPLWRRRRKAMFSSAENRLGQS